MIDSSKQSIAVLSTAEFLQLLHRKSIRLSNHQGRLRITSPSGALEPEMREELGRRKGPILAALWKPEESSVFVALSSEELSGRIPMTPAQQGIWLIDHFDPETATYSIPEAFRLDQSVDYAIFQQAADCLIARHSILRSSFHEEDGDLFSLIAPHAEARVGFADFSSLTEVEGERECEALLGRESRRPFDLKQAPLARFFLVRLAAHRHVVFSNLHHILADRLSLYILRRELAELSEAIARGEELSLPPLALQYADYAVWAARHLQSAEIKEQVAYWKHKLSGLAPFIELPHRRVRPERVSSRGATLPATVTLETRTALASLGMEERASPFMTLLAVFALLIWRVSQKTDFCIGSPSTHRNHPGTAKMVGLFVNMLAFRCHPAPDLSFRDLLRQVRGTALEAYENSDVPFQTLLKMLKPDRRAQRSPIFQVMFGYETYMPAIRNECQMDVGVGVARYDLSLHLSESQCDGLFGCFEYRTDLFEEWEIARLALQFTSIVNEVASNPDHAISDLCQGVAVPQVSDQPSGIVEEVEPGRLRRFVRRFGLNA